MAKNTIVLFLMQIAKYIFPLITVPFLTRVLGPEVYAVRAYTLAVMSLFLMMLEYGFNASGAKTIAETSDALAIRKELTSITFARCALCLIGLFPLIVLIVSVDILREYWVYTVIAYCGTCFKALLPDFVFQGLEEMGIITQRFVVSQLLSVVCIIAFVRSPDDLLLVPVFEGMAALIALMWSWQNVFMKRGLRFVGVDSISVVKAFKSSTPFFISNAATTLFTSLTTLMIGICISDAAEVSYWSVAMTAVSAIQSLYNPVANSLYPHMVKRRDFSLAGKVLKWGTIAAFVIAVAFALLSKAIVMVLAGPGYGSGAYVVALLAPVVFFSYPAIIMGFPILAAVGRIREVTLSSVAAAACHVGGLVLMMMTGHFTVANVSVLRCATELVFMLIRLVFVLRYKVAVSKDMESSR